MAKSWKYRRKRKALTLQELKLRLTEAVEAAEEIILDDGYTVQEKLSAIHALTQSVGSFAKLIEATELEKRLDELESLIEEWT